MKTLLLRSGDLVVSGTDYALVTGPTKITQDLRGAMLEPLGNDRFHPNWGAVLDTFLAEPIDETLRLKVQAEVNRIISNYAAVQRDRIDTTAAAQQDALYTTDEILERISGVDVQIEQDSISVVVHVRVLSGEVITLGRTVS